MTDPICGNYVESPMEKYNKQKLFTNIKNQTNAELYRALYFAIF